MSSPALHVPVIGTDDGYLYVAHGDRCVLLCEMHVPKWRNATGLTSEAARRLAAILVQQADAADEPRLQVSDEDRVTSTEHDAALFEARRGERYGP